MDETRMNFYFYYTKRALLILGLWPYQSWSSKIILRTFWIIQHTSILVAEAIKLYENRKNFDLIIESLAPFSYNIVMGIKFGNAAWNQQKLKSQLEIIKRDWNKLSDKEEIQILQYYSNRGKHFNIVYMSSMALVLISYTFIPIAPIVLDFIKPLNESRPKFPLYQVEFYVDQDKYFYSILTHAYITSLVGILPLLGCDSFFLSSAHHACGILEILGHRIRNIINDEFTMTKSGSEKEKAVACVIEHQNIIKYCEDMNSLYSLSFLFILGIAITLMSVTGYMTVIKLNESINDTCRFGMFTFAQIFHLFCYNFLGQILLNHGEKLTDYMCNCDWYKASIETKFIIRFMIMRSLKPSTIRAIIFPLSLQNFTALMKTAMSYFTVIKSSR